MLQCNLFLLAQEARTNSNEKAAQASKTGSASSTEAKKIGTNKSADDTKKSELNGKTGNTEPTEWSIFGNPSQASGTNTTAPKTATTGGNATSAQQEPSGWTIYTKRPTVVVYTVKSLIPENKWDY